MLAALLSYSSRLADSYTASTCAGLSNRMMRLLECRASRASSNDLNTFVSPRTEEWFEYKPEIDIGDPLVRLMHHPDANVPVLAILSVQGVSHNIVTGLE